MAVEEVASSAGWLGARISASGVDLPWASAFERLFGFSKDEARFVLMMLASVPNGTLWGLMPPGHARHLYAIVSGFLLLYVVFGVNFLTVYIPTLLVYAAMVFMPRHAGKLSYALTFPYLIWMHTVHASGETWREGRLDHTGVLMIATLKLVSMAQNYSDGVAMGPQKAAAHPRALERIPTFLEMLSFVMMAHNNFVGPASEIKPYLDFCNGTGAHGEKAPPTRWDAPRLKYLVFALARFVVCMGMFTHFSDLFPLSAMTGEDPASAFPSYSLWYKTLVGDLHIMTAVQTKYYGVWALAEVGMVLAGASKRVDEGGQAHWDLYNNFDGIRLNTASSPRLMPTYWNIGTGNWLRFYCYERILLDSRGKPTALSLLATQMVSAVWHGLSPGYLWFFFTTALFFECGKVIYKYSMVVESPGVKYALTATNYALGHVMMGQAGPAFMALTWEKTLFLVRQFYGSAQLFCVVVIALGHAFPPTLPGKPKGEGVGRRGGERAESGATGGGGGGDVGGGVGGEKSRGGTSGMSLDAPELAATLPSGEKKEQ